ncbi:unnamed protein product [Ambrosiozyma monospora]|uniref:Unnamed protein product n=1 Tax=Ambrosiozyma monospora TaxID=43982 RepID=A0A9W6YSB0_AMBMO|nr:unnamed protein product [Ambrosiozyma monospora]
MPSIALDDLTVNNLGVFNKITAPKVYPEAYLKASQESGELAQYAYFSEVSVGVITSKTLQPVNSKSPIGLLIEVIAVLESYSKKFDVELKLVEHIEQVAEKRHLKKVYVLLKKEDQSEWMVKFFNGRGFEKEDANAELYKGLGLGDGLLLKKEL